MEGSAMKTLVLGGWACPPSMLKPLFDENAILIDVNNLMSSLIVDGAIKPDWPLAFAGTLGENITNIDCLAGWSTGAILSLGLIPIIKPRMAVLLSATRSFCRKDDFRFGMPETMIRGMKVGLKTNRNKTLGQFFENCAIQHPFPDTSAYSTRHLIDGLDLLSQLSYSPAQLSNIDIPLLLLHGKKDRIIPLRAGMDLAETLGADILCLDGGHGFFLQKNVYPQDHLSSFMKKNCR